MEILGIEYWKYAVGIIIVVLVEAIVIFRVVVGVSAIAEVVPISLALSLP